MGASPIVAFTDGAVSGNPGPGGWGAIVVTPDGQVKELGGGSLHTTNNAMELSGAIAALEWVAHRAGPVVIYTDSTYLINGITKWVRGWQRRGWRTTAGGDVKNPDLWEQLARLTNGRGRGGTTWRWLEGHVGTPGNERADAIAVAFSRQQSPTLFEGPLERYGRPILDLPVATTVPVSTGQAGSAARATSKGAPYSYVSVVDDIPMRHATWSECEQRVKGRSGARHKKAMSEADELAILRAWGIDPSRL